MIRILWLMQKTIPWLCEQAQPFPVISVLHILHIQSDLACPNRKKFVREMLLFQYNPSVPEDYV